MSEIRSPSQGDTDPTGYIAPSSGPPCDSDMIELSAIPDHSAATAEVDGTIAISKAAKSDVSSPDQSTNGRPIDSTALVPVSIHKDRPNPSSQLDQNNEKEPSFKFPLAIAFRHVNVKLVLPTNHTPLPDVTTPIRQLGSSIVSCITGRPSTRDFYRVKNISGCIRPGTTLVLSPPGHGKTSYLKVISGEIPKTSGHMTFNGVPIEQANGKLHGADIRKLVAYQEQTDFHLSLLNVYETIQFASQMSSVHGSKPERIDEIIEALGLEECKSTLIGDAMVKGCSGGQKRRVTTGVAMSGDHICLCLDEYSNGLDSAVTEKITEYFVNWTRKNETSVVATLQQPTPTVFAMFDRIVLLREGEVVFDGPREDTLPYLEAMGFKCRDDVDACDFVIDVLSQPRQALYDLKMNDLREKQLADQKKKKAAAKKGGSGKKSDEKELQRQQLLALPQQQSPPSSSAKSTKAGAYPTVQTSIGPLRISPTPCLTTEEMVQFFHSTSFWKNLDQEINAYIVTEHTPDSQGLIDYSIDDGPVTFPAQDEPLLPNPDAKQRFSSGFRLPFFQTISYSLKRQIRIVSRNKPLIFTKWMNCFSISLIVAGLFYQVPRDNPQLKIAALLLSLSQSIYCNMIELSTVSNEKKLVQREIQASMYPGVAYVISSFTAALPFSIFDPFVFTLIFYFMEGLFIGFKEIITFWFLLILTTWCSWTWFRFCAILMPDMPRALILASPTVSYMSTFAGFYIARGQIKDWLIEFYYFSPFSWLLRAFAINEFNSPGYDEIVINAITGNPSRLGDANLDYVDMFHGEIWILYCTLYVLAFTLFFLFAQSLLLRRVPAELSRGTRRVKDSDGENLDLNNLEGQLLEKEQQEADQETKLKQLNSTILHSQREQISRVHSNYDHVSHSGVMTTGSRPNHHTTTTTTTDSHHPEPSTTRLSRTNMSSIVKSTLLGNPNSPSDDKKLALTTLTQELPFYPTSVSFSDLTYTVKVRDLQGNVSERRLLNGISGYAQPGQMIALMGASGAGKTTLLDVIAGLKNQGVITGKILFNGIEANKEVRGILTGYVQQFASLWGFSSVEETLLFAARLRMDKDIKDDVKRKVVDEVLDILDLKPIRNCIIGNFMAPGCSPSQIKIISIGLEMIANPAVLFLDEPTTGLDSKSAATVLKAVKRIASTGRTIIATVHQPSAELYYFFDRLYLLAPGGHQIFGGEVGYRSHAFVKYFSAIPGVEAMPLRSNPANWMLSESSKTPPQQYISIEYIKQNTTVLEDNNIDADTWTKDPKEGGVLDTRKWTLYLKWYYFHTAVAWYQVSQGLTMVEDIYYAEFPELDRPERKGPDKLTEKELQHLQASSGLGSAKPQPLKQITDQTDTKPSNDNTIELSINSNNKIDHIDDTMVVTSEETMADAKLAAQQGLHTPEHPPVLQQLIWMFQRHFTLYYRNPGAMTNRFVVLLSTSLITGLIYLKFNLTNTSSMISMAAAIIMAIATFSFNIANSTVPIYIFHRPVFYRETAQGYYSYNAIWSIGTTINELIWCIPLTIVSIPVWFMVGYPTSASVFFQFMLGMYTAIMTFLSAQQFFSALVPNMSFSQLATSLLTGLAFNLNGIGTTLTVLRGISGFHEALYWILPLGPLNLFLSHLIFGADPSKTISVVENGQSVNVLLAEHAQTFFGYSPDLHWWYYGILIIQFFCWQVAYHLTTTFLNHNKQ